MQGRTRLAGAAVVLAVGALVVVPRLDAKPQGHPVVVLSHFARSEVGRATPAALSAEPSTATEPGDSSVRVAVPSGPMTVARGPSRVTLMRIAGTDTFRGELTGILVLDTRGTDAGWHLDARFTAVGPGPDSTSVRVERVLANATSVAGLHPGGETDVAVGRWIRLVGADRGSGNGSYQVDVSITAEATATADRLELAVELVVE